MYWFISYSKKLLLNASSKVTWKQGRSLNPSYIHLFTRYLGSICWYTRYINKLELLCKVILPLSSWTQSYKSYKIFSVILQYKARAFITLVSIFPIRKQLITEKSLFLQFYGILSLIGLTLGAKIFIENNWVIGSQSTKLRIRWRYKIYKITDHSFVYFS